MRAKKTMFLKRLIVGLIIGGIVGAIVAAILVQGLGMAVTTGAGAFVAYLAAAGTGVLTGLVAGKPIWAAEGRIEAGLKAFFGMLLALGMMFVLRTWVHVGLDLTSLRAGSGSLGDLPAAYLPLIAGLLGGFFELDNSGDEAKEGEAKDGAKVRVAASSDDVDAEEEVEDEPAQAKKRR